MKRNNVAIRPAVLEDSVRVTELCLQLGYKVLEKDIRERLQNFMEQEQTETLVADEGGLILGWIQVGIRSSLESGNLPEITGLVVDESARESGIGKALVLKGEEWTRNMGYNKIRVRTNIIREEAHNFYKKIGFEEKKKQIIFQKELT
jgi:GNAT superfamily N-acetyltransferase